MTKRILIATAKSVADKHGDYAGLDRNRLNPLSWLRQGGVVLGYANVADLANVFKIPKGANTVCVSAADYSDIREWLA